MEITKLNIEMKGLKVSYEGPSNFLNDGLVMLCEQLSGLEMPEVEQSASGDHVEAKGGSLKMSTTDVAVKLASKSGSDLVMAAAAHLRFSKGREDFKRGDLLAEMKSAKSFYKQTYSNNLSKSLEGLVKGGRLSNPATDTYALPHAEEESIRGLLGL